jgi:uncharacterized membrane protein
MFDAGTIFVIRGFWAAALWALFGGMDKLVGFCCAILGTGIFAVTGG